MLNVPPKIAPSGSASSLSLSLFWFQIRFYLLSDCRQQKTSLLTFWSGFWKIMRSLLRCREAYTGVLVCLRCVPSTSLHPEWHLHLPTQPRRLSREAPGKQAAHPAHPVSRLLYVVPAQCWGLQLKTGEKYTSAHIFGHLISSRHFLDSFIWCLSCFACSLKICSKCLIFHILSSYVHTQVHQSHWENSLWLSQDDKWVWVYCDDL